MRTRYVQCKGKLVLVEEKRSMGTLIMPDIEPYQSMVDGSLITSRSRHREHLKQHGCVELGNEKPVYQGIPDTDAKQRKELIVAQIQEMGHEGFKRAMKRDIDFIKWNSNGLPRSK